MSNSHLFTRKMMPSTPKLIKYLVVFSLIFGCLSGFFYSLLGAKIGISFIQLFSLNIKAFVKGFFWQPFTFLFLPQIEGSLSFYFLFSLSFDLYLLWIIGCKVHQIFGPKTTLKLFGLPPIIGCTIASLIATLFHFPAPLFGLSFAMIPLIAAFCFSNTDGHFHFMPMPALQIRWLGLGLVVLYLLQDLSNLNFAAFLGHILVALISYVYLLYFHNLNSPFTFMRKLDDFILSKKRRPSSSKIIYLYDEETRKESAIDKAFNKIKNNEKLTVLDKLRLKRYRKKMNINE